MQAEGLDPRFLLGVRTLASDRGRSVKNLARAWIVGGKSIVQVLQVQRDWLTLSQFFDLFPDTPCPGRRLKKHLCDVIVFQARITHGNSRKTLLTRVAMLQQSDCTAYLLWVKAATHRHVHARLAILYRPPADDLPQAQRMF